MFLLEDRVLFDAAVAIDIADAAAHTDDHNDNSTPDNHSGSDNLNNWRQPALPLCSSRCRRLRHNARQRLPQ